MAENAYTFSAPVAFETIKAHWKAWAEETGASRWVVGISGGKDSTIVAGLAARIFGPENVWGVLLPNGTQADISDARRVASYIRLHRVEINIAKACRALSDAVNREMWAGITPRANINMPPRLRMAALYAVAQSIDGFVLNTSNLSEDMVGYATLWGDTTGSYAPVQHLTVTEVKALGDYLRLPHDLVHKAPADGLADGTDEDRLGLKYAELDRLIREGDGSDSLCAKVRALYRRNAFKLDMITLPGPCFADLPNFVPALCENTETTTPNT